MADQRIIFSEEMVGFNHPTKADTLNRLSLIEHNSDGTHSKLTKVTDPWIDVRAYGAVGDGVTDDTGAIQAALNAVAFTGGRVYLPFGTYKVSSTLTISNSTELFGVGGNGSIISATSTAGYVITVNAGGCYLHDFQVTASVAQTGGAHIFIAAAGSSSTIERFYLTNYFIGILVQAVCCVRILNGQCRYGVSGTWTAGIVIDAGTDHYIDHVTMDNVVGTQSESGIRVMAGDAILISFCDIIHHGTPLNIQPGVGQTVSSLYATHSWFDSSNMRGMLLGGSGTIIRCKFSDCWFSSNLYQGILVNNTGTIAGIDISNPHVFLNGGTGIQDDKTCDLKINGGFIGQNTGDGIAIGANVNNFSIIGTRSGNGGGVSGNTLYGIKVYAGTSNNYIISLCDVRGNTGGSVSDGGSGVNKIINNNMS